MLPWVEDEKKKGRGENTVELFFTSKTYQGNDTLDFMNF